MRSNIPSPNGRIYSKELLQKIAKDTNLPIFGQIGLDRHLSKCSHSVEKLFFQDNELKAEIRILDTPVGRKISDILNNQPCNVSFRIGGVGSLDETGKVNLNYKLDRVGIELDNSALQD